MKIETKLNQGDTFFALNEGKISQHTVNYLSIMTSSDKKTPVRISYYPVSDKTYLSLNFEEKDVFATKEELLKYIQS